MWDAIWEARMAAKVTNKAAEATNKAAKTEENGKEEANSQKDGLRKDWMGTHSITL
jgi:ubiquitin